MSRIFLNHRFHLTWSTENRENLINEQFKGKLYGYIKNLIKKQGGILLEMGGTSNHVHILMGLDNLNNASKLINKIKSSTSLWVNNEKFLQKKMNWQKGYSSYSVSNTQVDAVRQFIQSQDSYHTRNTFEDEYVELLNKHNVNYDDKYKYINSFKNHWFHLVWSTKNREKTIKKEWQTELYKCIENIIIESKGSLLEIGGVEDHVHILVFFKSLDEYFECIRKIKGGSSSWINKTQKINRRLYWQDGYGSFSVSYSQIENVRNYIRNQEAHHKKISFENEFYNCLLDHDMDTNYLNDFFQD